MHKQTISQCCAVCPNETETLAKVTQCLSKEGVNIDCMLMETLGSMCCIRFMCDRADLPSLQQKLEACGCRCFEDQVSCAELPNRPGELAKLCKRLADEKIQVRYMYGCSQGKTSKMILCCDKPEAAARVVKECCGSMAAAPA